MTRESPIKILFKVQLIAVVTQDTLTIYNRYNSTLVLSQSLKPMVVVCTETLSPVGGGGDKGGITGVASELKHLESARRRTTFTASLLETEGLYMNFESLRAFLPATRFVPRKLPEHGSRTDRSICRQRPADEYSHDGRHEKTHAITTGIQRYSGVRNVCCRGILTSWNLK